MGVSVPPEETISRKNVAFQGHSGNTVMLNTMLKIISFAKQTNTSQQQFILNMYICHVELTNLGCQLSKLTDSLEKSYRSITRIPGRTEKNFSLKTTPKLLSYSPWNHCKLY